MNTLLNLIKTLDKSKIKEEKRRLDFDTKIDEKFFLLKKDIENFKVDGIQIYDFLDYLECIIKPRILFNLLNNDKICLNLSLNTIKQLLLKKYHKKLNEKRKFIIFLKNEFIDEFKQLIKKLELYYDVIISIEIYTEQSFLIIRESKENELNVFTQKNVYIKNYLDDVKLIIPKNKN